MNTKEYEAEFQLKDCQICGIVIKDHPRCSVCGILTGPQHIEVGLHRLRNGKLALTMRTMRNANLIINLSVRNVGKPVRRR